MSISPLSLGFSMLQSSSSSGSSRRQDFTQLASELRSGNLQGAQQTFASLEQLQGGQSSSPGGGSSGSATNPVANDFAALGQALSSGDLSQAQSSFTQLQTDIQSVKQSGSSGVQMQVQGYHHHHGGGGDVPPLPPSAISGSMNPGPIGSGGVNLVG
jgi:hypothetical protein